MFEQLFGSKTRFRLLYLFFTHLEERYYIRQLTRITEAQINSIRREVQKLEEMGIIRHVQHSQESKDEKKGLRDKKYFEVNKDFILYRELRDLLIKSNLMAKQDLYEKMKRVGNISYLALSGNFVNIAAPTDILVVGEIDKKAFEAIIKRMEVQLEKDIRYTHMGESEFKYRQDITDRFVYDFMNGKKIILIDRVADENDL